MRSYCPPGVFCISSGVILCIILFIFIGAAIYLKPQTIIVSPPQSTQNITSVQDSRFSQAPQPLRDWMGRPEFPPRGGIASIPINIPTQGLPESFQSVGIIKAGDQILPLYGRRTIGSNDRWNYYTRTDTFNPVPIPVQYQRRNCMDDVGCQEMMSGEHVHVNAMKKDGQVEIYRFDGPKYIPGLL